MVNADEAPVDAPDDPGTAGNDGAAPARWDESAQPDNAEPADGHDSGRKAELPSAARDWIVRTVSEPMAGYCARGGKRLYCDKSLDSVHHLALVHELMPDTRMMLVFRHVMDTVASGIEASPWGFQAYGYAPYVQASPGNAVAALASYWLDHVAHAMAWESEHPDICRRVRYEDLVLRPAETIAGIQAFLGVAEDLSVLERAFDRVPPRGPGDYKVEHTSAVHAASIGHGKRVPVTLLPPALLAALNEKLEALGYDALDRGWNAAERPVDGGGKGIWAARLTELMREVRVSPAPLRRGSFAVVAEDHRALRWVIDPATGTVEQGDGDVDRVLTGTAEDLVLALAGEENLGVLLRSGRLRHLVADESETVRRDLMRELGEILDTLRGGSASPVPDEDTRRAVA
jgi:hypothetical protein